MRVQRALLITIFGAMLLTGPAAAADTVYLKNGRSLRTPEATVEGERVLLRLYGGQLVLPLSVVDRVVDDDAVEPPPTVTPAADLSAEEADPQIEEEAAAAAADPADPADEVAPPVEPPATQTREYWQNQVAPLHAELGRLEQELDRLRTLTGAAVQVRIDRLEATRRQLQEQLEAIGREARRLGIPAGWLR
jgi:hypothetical protein